MDSIEKILIIGPSGLIGSKILQYCKLKKINANGLSVRVTSKDDLNNDILKDKIYKLNPSTIINCAALLGMKECYENSEDAFLINGYFPKYLSDICEELELKLFQISTEAVFPSNKTTKLFNESDIPKPSTIYGKSKLLGEENVKKNSNSFIIRLPRIIDKFRQIIPVLINKICSEDKVLISNDTFSTPIHSECAAEELVKLILHKTGLKKITHLTGDKILSLFEIILQLIPTKDVEKVHPISASFFNKDPNEEPFLNGGMSSSNNHVINFERSILAFKNQGV
ncbi:MAG: hypothetical protein CMM91_01635 [Rickettsiales bacterium]|nr:hypothetical protein [Rickettsiales bacterium]|tara:strand:- start:11873 stop:12721 length:849 start_codon:yes stop_codon:yes gene_type:complete